VGFATKIFKSRVYRLKRRDAEDVVDGSAIWKQRLREGGENRRVIDPWVFVASTVKIGGGKKIRRHVGGKEKNVKVERPLPYELGSPLSELVKRAPAAEWKNLKLHEWEGR